MKLIPLFVVHMPESVDKPLLETLHSGYVTQGPKVDEYEKLLSEKFDNKNTLTVNTGTSALHLALRLANVSVGDEVITTPMTCNATNMPILANSGTIVWADVNSSNGLIDPLDVERKITKKTKVIIGVDWGGTSCDWDKLMEIGEKYDVKVIEDAAHSIGMKYKGRIVGNLADFTVLSTQAIKHITTVDGGVLFCKSTEDYKRGKLLRWYGIDRGGDRRDPRIEEDVVEWGYKFHMNDLMATIGIEQLKYLDGILEKHRANAAYYSQKINNKFYVHPKTEYAQESSFWIYTVLLPSDELKFKFKDFMKENGVMVSSVHARNDTHTVFKSFWRNLPGVEAFNNRQISIPVHWKLTNQEREKIVKLCNSFAINFGM